VLLRLASEINAKDNIWDEILFADDVIKEKEIMGKKVFPFSEIEKNFSSENVEFVISLGEPFNRKMLHERVIKAGFNLCNPIDPNKDNIKYNNFGKGVVISKNVGISINVTIGDNTYVGTSATVGHDGTIGSNSFICGSSIIGGCCAIGENTFIGMNSTVKDHTNIGSNVIVAMGSCVFNDLPDNVKVIGNPAKVIPNLGKNIFS